MSTAVVTDSGKAQSVQATVDTVLADATVHLFTNNHAPTVGSIAIDFTEATYPGYSSSPANFGSAATTTGEAHTDTEVQTFSCTGDPAGAQVFGYYVMCISGTVLYMAEKFDDPIDVVEGFDIQFSVRWRERTP